MTEVESERRIVFTAREQAELESFARPAEPLADDQVEGRTLATLVSAGTELEGIYLGERFPAHPGYAAVFEVQRAGSGVTDVRPGDRLFCQAGHGSFVRVRRQDATVVPAGLDPRAAVFARMMLVSMTTLVTTEARPPACVAVTGLGPVGHMAAQVFAAAGYDVVGVDPDAGRREMAAGKGIARVVERIDPDDPLLADRVVLVVECSGHEQAVLDACRAVRRRGEVVLVGVPWQPRTTLSAHDLLHAVFHRYVVLRSGWEWELPRQSQPFVRGSLAENAAGALRWLAEGRVDVRGLWQSAQPAEAQQVYQDLLRRRTEKLAVVFDWTA